MTYTLSALIAHEGILKVSTASESLMRIATLKQSFGMIPITMGIQKDLAVDDKRGFREENPFYHLSDGVQKFALKISLAGQIAYVEAEFFGGVGYQSAILWENGGIILGPFLAQNLPLREMPINRVLREMGIEVGEKMDEFDTLGLGQHRRIDEWLTTAT